MGISNIYAQSSFNNADKFKTQHNYADSFKQNFDNYVSTINKNYSDYLRGVWDNYNAFAPISTPKEEIKPIIYNKKDTVIKKNEQKIIVDNKDVVFVNKVLKNSTPIQPDVTIKNKSNKENEELLNTIEKHRNIVQNIKDKQEEKKGETINKDTTISISFYKTIIEVRLSVFNLELDNISNNNVADAWEQLQYSQLNKTIEDCLDVKENLNLCDWAYLEFVHKLASEIHRDKNKITLLTAYILEQSGYDIKIGRRQNKLYMLYSSQHDIYNHQYFMLDGKKYYPHDTDTNLDNMEICNVAHNSLKTLSLYIEREQKFDDKTTQTRIITASNTPQIEASANKNLLDFYSSYPTSRIQNNDMTRWAMYAQTPINKITREPLYEKLRTLISNKSEIEAANILLNFVQTGFEYKYDNDVWGQDRAFFAEETLTHPYSDCEDRSILFSHLVRDLLELEVALVYSPSHLFTAVKFSNEVDGSYITINNEKYTICEPTCITGAPVGFSAEENNNQQLKVILLSKINYGKSYKAVLSTIEYKRSLFPICINGKYGYKNKENKIIVPCKYDSLRDNKRGDLFFYVAIESNKMDLIDSNGRYYESDIEDYIPLEIHTIFDVLIGDYCAIVKEQGKWYFKDLNSRDPGLFFYEFCLDEYCMDDVTFEKNIYCEPQDEKKYATKKYIILKKKSNNKYGVLMLCNYYQSGHEIHIPFEYDNISFIDNDKSKVKVYKSSTSEYKVISLGRQ